MQAGAGSDGQQRFTYGEELLEGDLIPDHALREHDADRFDRGQIAKRLADLVCRGEPPLSIALFGPWGSGKSSIFTLLSRTLAEHDGVRLIRYDAWKYGGAALKRNFIAHTARALELDENEPGYDEFRRGLYETRRVAEISSARLFAGVRALSLRFAVLFALFVAIFAVLAGCASVLTDEDFFGEIAHVLPGFLTGSATVALLAAVVRTMLDVGTVNVEQSKVSEDERFTATFERLLETAKKSASAKRLVFFVDELDRCSREDVVATLKAIRTFLDQPDTVFVVAADRQVIERALPEAEQSTPLDATSPYYSTASAFLDKIFQHQITLPPLRPRRLTTYARELVRSRRGGLWATLAEGGDDDETPQLDELLYVLIPSHVHSPRRVKVLLNNFAVNARIAQTRIPGALPARAREIAKLTVLQTEFPQLAADLAREPRLPRFLLDGHEAPPTVRRELLPRWRLPDDERDEAPLEADPVRDADALMVQEAQPPRDQAIGADGLSHDDARLQEVRHRRRHELKRYLERTADVPDIRHDLLYLQSAGADVGLHDPELAERIERDSTDAPDAVVDAIEQVEPDQQLAAAELLASMVDEVLSVERENVMTALTAVVVRLGDAARAIDGVLIGSLRAYQRSNELLDVHRLGAVRIATLRDEPSLLAELLDDEWLKDPDVVTEVASTGPLPKGTLPDVRAAVAEAFARNPRVLVQPLARLSQRDALALLGDDLIFRSVRDALDDEPDDEGSMAVNAEGTVCALVDPLLDARRPRRPALVARVVTGLLDVDGSRFYEPLVRRVGRVQPALSSRPDQLGFLLALWAQAPADAWERHAREVTAVLRRGDRAPFAQLTERVAATVTHMLRQLDGDPARTAATADRLAELAPLLAGLRDEHADDLIGAVDDVLQVPWIGDDDRCAARVELHRLLVRLARCAPGVETPLRLARGRDLVDSRPPEGDSPAVWLRGVGRMADELDASVLEQLQAAVPEDGAGGPEGLLARLALARRLRDLGTPGIVPAQFQGDVIAAAREHAPYAAEAFAEWLALAPDPPAVAEAIRALGDAPTGASSGAARAWARAPGAHGGGARRRATRLVTELVQRDFDAERWTRALTGVELDEAPIVARTRGELFRERAHADRLRVDERRHLVSAVSGLGLRTRSARSEIARICCALLEPSQPRNDVGVVLRLVRVLRGEFDGGQRLAIALERHRKRHRYEFTRGQRAELAAAGLRTS